MAKTKSAKKALKKALKKRVRNLVYINKIKNLVKRIKKLIINGKIEESKNLLPQLYKILDKAAKEGIIKKNTAARKKSRITKLINLKLKTQNPS